MPCIKNQLPSLPPKGMKAKILDKKIRYNSLDQARNHLKEVIDKNKFIMSEIR